MKKVLDVKDLCVTYSNKERSVYAVQNVSFSLNEGDSIGIVGESGSGKSTLVMALLRLLSEQTAKVSGECYLNGKELLSLPPEPLREMRWTEMAIVFQKAMNALSPVHRICTQIEDIYREHAPKATRQQIKDRTMELFRMVGLPERVYRLYPHEVSGGMLQRVAIVISLLHQPKLLVFDEATTALDVVTQGQILEEIVRLEKNLNMTRIMITHDMSVVAASCKKWPLCMPAKCLKSVLPKVCSNTPCIPIRRDFCNRSPRYTVRGRNCARFPAICRIFRSS